MTKSIATIESIQRDGIICLPGRPPAMLDRDVARVFETTTGAINQAADRNNDLVTEPDFRFQVTKEERSQIVIVLQKQGLGDLNGPCPWLYTRLGCNTLPFLLRSQVARARAQQVARAFTALEEGRIEELLRDRVQELAREEARRQVEQFLLAEAPQEWERMFTVEYMQELCRINANAFFDPKSWRSQGLQPMIDWIVYRRLPKHVYARANEIERYPCGSRKNRKHQMFTEDGQQMIASLRDESLRLAQSCGYNSYYTEFKPRWEMMRPIPDESRLAVQIPLFAEPVGELEA